MIGGCRGGVLGCGRSISMFKFLCLALVVLKRGVCVA